MNFPIDAERLRNDANLRGWSEYCREVKADRLPKTILHVCQAIYDAVAPDHPPIKLKHKVLDFIADGDCSAAVNAMMPRGVEARFKELPHGRVLADVRHVGTETRVVAEGWTHDAALLGGLVELSLTLDPVRRMQVFA